MLNLKFVVESVMLPSKWLTFQTIRAVSVQYFVKTLIQSSMPELKEKGIVFVAIRGNFRYDFLLAIDKTINWDDNIIL